jgi:hypothetical protein
MRLVFMLWIGLSVLLHAQERTWTSEDGKKIVGELLRETGDAVVLKVNNREFTVPLSRLGEEDREWLAGHRKQLLERQKEFASLGGTTKTFAKNDSQQVTFHVYYPTSYKPENPPPMLILFSASGQGKGLLGQFTESCEKLGWIGVGCDTFRNGVDDVVLDPLFEELLPIIEKTVVHNPERLYMGGISGGAMRALGYSAKFERPWKGIISCGGWLGKQYDLKYAKRMAVAWVNGDNDKAANSWVEGDSAVLKKRSCKTKLFQFPGGHVVGPPAVLTEAMQWVDENSR